MEVIDKTKKNKEQEWHVGDVVCYWYEFSDKNYSMISKYSDSSTYYYLTDLSTAPNSEAGHISCKRGKIEELIISICDEFDHVEKVNAKLVIEDEN